RKPSPVAFTTCPPRDAIASLTISSCRASASCITSGCCSHRRVEPSRSVNKKVTVPDGNPAMGRSVPFGHPKGPPRSTEAGRRAPRRPSPQCRSVTTANALLAGVRGHLHVEVLACSFASRSLAEVCVDERSGEDRCFVFGHARAFVMELADGFGVELCRDRL